jgi:tripartite-type tricarboxylate transporter receptor subunit TctC
MKLLAAAAAALAAVIFGNLPASAQSWPTRPVTMIVPFAAGGATDAIARALAQRLSEGLGQQVVVENRAGAGGGIGALAAAKAAPDGHTILMATTSTHVILPLTQASLGYDALKDFAAVGMVATAPNILIASPKLPAASIAELIAYAKSNPGKVNFASSGQGTITHLIGELFTIHAGIEAVHIPYKTGVQSFAELNEGQVHFLFDSIVWSLPQIRAGKLKGLGITSAQRSSLAPDLPTVAESGLPNFEGVTWFGLVAPARTPDVAINRLQTELKAALADPELSKRLAVLGAEPANTGKSFDDVVREDLRKWGDVIKRAGAKSR